MILDAGALIAFERNVREVVALVKLAEETGEVLVIPAGVIAQVWRNGSQQARLARLLASEVVEIETLDEYRAKSAGMLCGLSKTSDVIDASVVVCAKARRRPVMTSDPDDLLRLDPNLTVIRV